MPTYATRADCLDYTEGLTVGDTVAFDRLIERAEKDVDSVLGEYAVDEVTGRKFAPADLTTAQANALRDATCAQVEYRVEMGERFFTRAQYSETSGPDFTKKGKLPYYAPKLVMELRGSGLVAPRTARASA
jgi:hypothetical protein